MATKFGEIAQKRPLRRSSSFKVTDFGANRKPMCDFLLVININLGLHHYLALFPSYRRLLVSFAVSADGTCN